MSRPVALLMDRRGFLGFPLLLAAAPALAADALPRRVVCLGGTVTEIVYALGCGDRVVGVDDSSVFPPAATRLPRVGYYRSFAVEGVASLAPDLVIASTHAGPPHAFAQLRQLGVPVVSVPSDPLVDSLVKAVATVADTFGVAERGERLVADIHDGIALAERRRPSGPPARVLLLSSHTGRLQAAGRETAADAMLALAGARNVFDAQSGYKAISPETVAALKPDAIVTTRMTLRALGSLEAFAAQPGIAVTPAARSGRIVVMDDLLLLGFGPRLPDALHRLQDGLASHAGARG